MTQINFVNILLVEDKRGDVELPPPDRSNVIMQPGSNLTARWEAHP